MHDTVAHAEAGALQLAAAGTAPYGEGVTIDTGMVPHARALQEVRLRGEYGGGHARVCLCDAPAVMGSSDAR